MPAAALGSAAAAAPGRLVKPVAVTRRDDDAQHSATEVEESNLGS